MDLWAGLIARGRALFLGVFLLAGCELLAKIAPSTETSPMVFEEVWAYLRETEETFFPKQSAITDVAYFCARIDEEGRLSSFPSIDKLPPSCKSLRKHVVIACSHNRAQMYWLLRKDPLAKEQLIEDVIRVSNSFDGVQIDFEGVRAQEAEAFLDFLRGVRERLDKKKCLSVAVIARMKDQKDAFPYAKIAAIADRVVVMAYDEHWRTSKPGPIASLPWCEKVCTYAQKNIPSHKLVMGIPLYGRVWALQEVSASLRYASVLKLWERHKTPLSRLQDAVPYFAFEEKVKAECYFEDIQSLKTKLAFYQSKKVPAVAFWRVSQEPAKLWQCVESSKTKTQLSKK